MNDLLQLRSIFDFDSKTKKLKDLNSLISDKDFWSSNKDAKNITKEASSIEKVISLLNKLENDLNDLNELIELSKDEVSELEQVKIQIKDFETKLEVLEEESLFNGEYDNLSAVLNINAGAGGVDAHDWADILFRMYTRFLDNENMDYEKWPYDHPFFIIINLAIGGDWGGQQGIDNSIFPSKYLIDYVRMFKKK